MTKFSKVAALSGAILSLVFVAGAQAQTGQPSTMGNMPDMSNSSATGSAQASATGIVTAVNVAQHKVTFDHGPIPAISWPAMKMEFPVVPAVDLTKVKPGSKVRFTLSGTNGSYTVQSITPDLKQNPVPANAPDQPPKQ